MTRSGGLHVQMLGQGDDLHPDRTIREELVGGRADHEWARGREVPQRARRAARRRGDRALPERAGHDDRAALAAASGAGSRWPRRCSTTPSCCCSTSRPTTSTSRASTGWREHLAARRGSMLVVTHDRWFLDAVSTLTWEVADTTVHQYEGGYAAYVLARAERARQAAAREERRQQLIRKELAWLRRGPPARTSKPKFRIEAANALIADEPEPRDKTELLRFASSRLGNKVLDAEGVSIAYGEKVLLRDATWRLGPGDRVAIVGVNGSGKTSLMKLLSGDLEPATGEVTRGATVKLAFLSQDTAEIPGHLRVLESVEADQGPRPPRRRHRADRRDAVRALRLRRREGPHAGEGPVRRRAPPAAAHAPADGRAQRPAARRAHQRPRHRHADRARGPARRLARHARGRLPRSLLRRARVRQRLRAHRRRQGPPPPGRDRAVPRAAPPESRA